jgi:hypothetical protein
VRASVSPLFWKEKVAAFHGGKGKKRKKELSAIVLVEQNAMLKNMVMLY